MSKYLRLKFDIVKYGKIKNRPKTPAERIKEEQRAQAMDDFIKKIPGIQVFGMICFFIGCFCWLWILYTIFKILTARF